MKRRFLPVRMVRVGSWFLFGVIAAGVLGTAKPIHAEDLSDDTVSVAEYYARPDANAEMDVATVSSPEFADEVLADEVLSDEVLADEGYTEEQLTEADLATEMGTEVVCPACQCATCKGKCPGVSLDPGRPKKPKHKKPGDIDESDCPSKRYRMDDCRRSGDPNCVYKWAKPSITDKYSAWYVGGGAAFKGRGRTAAEGTWGLDYDGFFGHARTWLNYSCGKRQGGEGAYQTDHVPLKDKF